MLTACLVIATVGLQGSAAAKEPGPFQALLNPDGSGRLFTNNNATPAWDTCAPDLSGCHPFATGHDISTSGAPPGVVFWSADPLPVLPVREEWRSPVWNGDVTPAAPPSISGEVRADEFVVPAPGGWHGGWATDRDEMQLAACESPEGSSCTTLTERSYPASCPGGAVVIDPVFVGQYLRVADQRVGPDTYGFGPAWTSPYGRELWVAGPTVSVAMVGQIAAPLHPRTVWCGPPPLVRASISKSATAAVRCGLGCRALLLVKRAGRAASGGREVEPFPFNAPSNQPAPKLSLSARAVARLGPGRARAVLSVDGRSVAKRFVRLAPHRP